MAGQMQKPKTLQARIVAGSVILLSGSGLTTAINLAYNIAVARFLGPKGFGHATAVYTILTLISAVTLSSANHLREVRGASEFAGGKICRLPRLPCRRLDLRHIDWNRIVAVSDGDYKLPESAKLRPCCHARHRSSILCSAGKPARIYPGGSWLQPFGQKSCSGRLGAAGWIFPFDPAWSRREGSDRCQCRGHCGCLSCHSAEGRCRDS